MKDERTIAIDINLTRGLVGLLALALLMAAFVGYLAWNQAEVAASGPQAPLDSARDRPLASSAGLRGYYLTTTNHNGAAALTACAAGYHFASLWEIVEPSNLKYNTTLGRTMADSGQGPPSANGWVRTGYSSSTTSTAGRGNCAVWTSNSTGDQGTRATLPNDWTGGFEEIHVWDVSTSSCGTALNVWCVADDVSGGGPYLPIILKNSS